MRVYLDFDMTNQLGLVYYGEHSHEEIQVTPNQLIKLRGYRGYDSKHMDFFNEVGLDTVITLKNEGLGWFSVFPV